MSPMPHRTTQELELGLAHLAAAPRDRGAIELIVRRPAEGEREVLDEAHLDLATGLVGDTWHLRPSSRTPDRTPHPDMQLNLMNARAIALLAGDRARWPLAGDQFYLDLDLSTANLPPGTRLQLGTATIEVTAQPHTGCKKFQERFGADALRFVNSPAGRALNLRGINAKVVRAGTVRRGDLATKLT